MYIYYVYIYLNDSNEPYYVGKGKNRRHKAKHTVPVPCDADKIKFIATRLSNDESLLLERKLILHYGRKDIGTGSLLNKTSGGQGSHMISEETRAKLSAAKKNYIPWNKGKTGVQEYSTETRDRMSKSASTRHATTKLPIVMTACPECGTDKPIKNKFCSRSCVGRYHANVRSQNGCNGFQNKAHGKSRPVG